MAQARAVPEETSGPPTSRQANLPEASLIRLLVVDDDPAARLVVQRALRRGGPFRVDEAQDGEGAMRLLDEKPFDVVLSDYRMGAKSGIDVLAYTLTKQPHARRVLMSGFADAAVLQAAHARASIHHFLEKPIRPGDFEEALLRVLDAASDESRAP